MIRNFLVVAFACALGIGCIEAEAFEEPDATEDSKTVDHSEVTLPDADVQDPDTVDPDVVLTEVVCESDSDCADVTEEICQLASCHGSGVCMIGLVPNGAQCADEDPCTIDETCLEGACTAGGEMPCIDELDCTEDSCDSEAGCVFTPNDSLCADDPCISYACDAEEGCIDLEDHETLLGTLCNDGDACTGDWDAGEGDFVDTCQKSVLPGVCLDDGDEKPCTIDDDCEHGACTDSQTTYYCGGVVVGCDDGDPCTDDVCETAMGCQYKNNTGPCDDENACTDEDVCSNGNCQSGDELDCDDEVQCTIDSCNQGSGCVHDAEAAVDKVCDDGNACTGQWDVQGQEYFDTCSWTEAQECQAGPEAGEPCADEGDCDGQPCEMAPVVECLGETIDCDDEELCTFDYCDGLAGCKHNFNTDSCDDGDACTEADQCQDGVCVSGDALNCDDENECTLDKCDDEDGCVHAAIDVGQGCDDENACTGHPLPGDLYKDFCEIEPLTDSGLCLSGGDPSPGDGDPCTVNEDCPSYDEVLGLQFCEDVETTAVCAGPEIACDDGNECTQDICDLESGCVSDDLSGLLCHEYDEDPCVTGFVLCDEGACIPSDDNEVDCDDDNTCTDDLCDPNTEEGCLYTHVDGDCADDDACTENETCVEQECVGQPVDCDDDNVCTTEYCSTHDGCVPDDNLGAGCDDGDPCTVGDSCGEGGICVQGATVDCDDEDPCTTDFCDAPSGDCVHVNNSVSCSDDNACTENDVCADGSCIGDDVFCGDDTECTRWECYSGTGCQEVQLDNEPCDDSNPCTPSSVCDGAGVCEGVGEVNCDDDNPCTADDCDAGASGCVYTEAGGEVVCDDEDPCTESDTCLGTECVGANEDCDDGNDCTTDSCDPLSGDCVHVSEGCGCTSNTGCDDGKICTVDTCEVGLCVNTNQQDFSCVDGDPCTVSSSCNANGECRATANEHKDCDDSNSCTADSCVVGDGGEAVCIHVGLDLIGEPCDDGLPCTVNDVCVVNGASTQCQGSNYVCPPVSCSVGGCVGPGDDEPECAYTTVLGQGCDDGDLCTSDDVCAADGTCSGEGVDCVPNDPNPCRVYSCDQSDGSCESSAASVETACDDEDPCTVNDHCHGSASNCVSGGALSCDDENECTQDSCLTGAAGGGSPCIHQALQNQGCDDGNSCTLNDICTASSQCAGFVNDCDDNNPCTSDICDQDLGVCIYALNDGFDCSDGDACTSGETCDLEGACSGGSLDSWTITQGSQAGDDEARDIVALASGGWIAVGKRYVGGTNQEQGWIVRFDDQGSPLWQTTLGGAGNDVFNGVTLRPDNESEIIAVGGKEENSSGSFVERPWAVRVSTDNGGVMTDTYSSNHVGSLRAVAPTEWAGGIVGKYVMAGQVDVEGLEQGLVILASATGKINNGAPVWQEELIQSSKYNHVRLNHISVLGTNSYLVAGSYRHKDQGDWDGYFAITSYDENDDYMSMEGSVTFGEGMDDRVFDAVVYTVDEGTNVSTRALGVGMSETPDEEGNTVSRGLMVEWDVSLDAPPWTKTGAYTAGEGAVLRSIAEVSTLSSGEPGFVIVGKASADLNGNSISQDTGWIFEFKKGDNNFPQAANTTAYYLPTITGFAGVALNEAGSAYGVAGARHSAQGDLQAFVVQTTLSGGVCGL